MGLSRRLFASLLPAAPAIASQGVDAVLNSSSPTESTRAEVVKAINSSGLIGIQNPQRPTTWSAYQGAREKYFQKNKYHRQLREAFAGDMDESIVCLKSVATQHKLRMQVKLRRARQKAEQSFLESLGEKFGVTDYLKQMYGNSSGTIGFD